MADAVADPFDAAKTSLRDTVKWLATVFSALAATVVGGASIVGLAGVKGDGLALALIGGGVGITCLFMAAGLALKLLTAESFHLGDITTNQNLRTRLDRYANDILPPEFSTVESFIKERADAIDQIRKYLKTPSSKEYQGAHTFLLSIDPPLSRLVNLAQFELMRTQFAKTIPVLFALALGALAGLGAFAVTVGSAKDAATKAAGTGGPIVSISLTRNAASIGASYAALCAGGGDVSAEIVGQPRANWLTVRITQPTDCAGTILSFPVAVVSSDTTEDR
jgi:hypothetical protein